MVITPRGAGRPAEQLAFGCMGRSRGAGRTTVNTSEVGTGGACSRTASQKVQLLCCAASFVIAAYEKYASFLRICAP